MVNGVKIGSRRQLNPGDAIRLGETDLVVDLPPAPTPAPVPGALPVAEPMPPDPSLELAAALDSEGARLRTRVLGAPLTGSGELESLWTGIGLRDVEQSSLTMRLEYRSFADYWEPYLGGQGSIGPYVAGLGSKRRSVLEHHVRLAYLAGREDGPRSFAATAWVVVFVLAFGELGTSILVAPPGESTLPIRIYTIIANTPASQVAALALLQALVIFAGAVAVLGLVAALAFDVGMVMLERRTEQNAADAAALLKSIEQRAEAYRARKSALWVGSAADLEQARINEQARLVAIEVARGIGFPVREMSLRPAVDGYLSQLEAFIHAMKDRPDPDRMIGALFCISLVAYAIITRRKDVAITSVFAAGLLSILMTASYSLSDAGASSIELSSETTPAFYNPQNLLVLFAVVNGLLVVPAAIGFLYMKNSLLKIPLLASLLGSFSWLALSDISLLVADRWIILSGIFLAIFAGFGIIHVAKNLPPRFYATVAGSVLAAFAIIGIAYAIMPYDNPFVLYGATRADIQDFAPVTMQFNSLDIQDNDKMMSAIAWINQNTEQDAVIVGEKHWRGFMDVYLEDERKYRFSNNPQALAEALERRGQHAYLVRFDGSPTMFAVEDVAIR